MRSVTCAGFQIYTREGQHYQSTGHNHPSDWKLLYNGTIARNPTGAPTKLPFGSFKSQTLNPGETLAFYVAFIECSSFPLSVAKGYNYSLGEHMPRPPFDWAERETGYTG